MGGGAHHRKDPRVRDTRVRDRVRNRDSVRVRDRIGVRTFVMAVCQIGILQNIPCLDVSLHNNININFSDTKNLQ